METNFTSISLYGAVRKTSYKTKTSLLLSQHKYTRAHHRRLWQLRCSLRRSRQHQHKQVFKELDNTRRDVEVTSSINLWLLQISHRLRVAFVSVPIYLNNLLFWSGLRWCWRRLKPRRNDLKWSYRVKKKLSASDEPFKVKLITIASLQEPDDFCQP